MKKLLVSVVLIVLGLNAAGVLADEKGDANLSFWDKLRAKIEQIVPQKKVAATTAVGGVRGSQMVVEDVYWKGEKLAGNVAAEELEAFKRAMALAVAGEPVKAQVAFNEFVSKNPESPLRKDADHALAQLQTAK